MCKRVNFTVNLFLLAAFVVIPFVPVSAQLNPTNLTQYTEKDGVPGATVNSLLVDKFGYIWLGTINGLARYDGYEFKRYFSNPNDSTSIKGLVVWSLFEDRKGQIWVATGPSNLNKYDPATRSFRQYGYSHLIEHPANIELGIRSMCQDANGRIYFGVSTNFGETIPGGLLYLDEGVDTIKKYNPGDSLVIQNVFSIAPDKLNNVWFLSFSGIFKIDPKGKLSKYQSLESGIRKLNEFPYYLQVDQQNHIWILTEKSTLFDFDPSSGNVTSFAASKALARDFVSYYMVFDKADNIWITSSYGLSYFDKKQKQFMGFNPSGGKPLATSSMLDLRIDSFGTVWIGTSNEGLLKYEEKARLKSYSFNKDDKISITPGWANNFVQTADGNIWLSTTGQGRNGGLNLLDGQGKLIYSMPFSSLSPHIVHLSGAGEFSPGELLISTNEGIFQFNTATKKTKKTTLNGYTDQAFINYFYKDKKHNQWLCTNAGLYRKSVDRDAFDKYDLSKLDGANASSNEVTRVFESEKYGLWLLTNNGLFLYDYKADKIIRHGYDKKTGDVFITQDINSFYEDNTGTAWVGTWQGGLSKYNVKDRKIKYYTRNDGLPSMSIQGILGDEKNQVLWLSTFDGLCRFDMKTGQTNNYSIADGIQSQLFADGSNIKTSKGLFLFGGSNGITIINPEDFNKNSIPPRVLITDLKLFNKSVVPGQSQILKNAIYDIRDITFEHDQNNITLDFIALHYANPAKNKYAYRMENYDDDWREAGSQHEAFYPKLPPGKYVFRVKAANNNGVWNEEGASLSITVLPPWWQTPWAYGVYAIALLALGFLGNKYLRHRLLTKEREKNRERELAQAKEIEKAYHKLEETHETLKATQSQLIQSEKMASLGELTAGIAHEIQNPLNFINNFSEINTELIDELNEGIEKGNLDEVKAIASDIRENESKINHHGKRADAIVKGMLQHSRVSTGQKEPADINALVDEYIRLSYHGLRAKDKSFNATLKSELDQSLGDIRIIPQDIGRVLLNLLNNAFFSVTEKSKLNIAGYEPTVSVTTKNLGDKVRISVQDNGMGIPADIQDKIFQPFFTTKSSGQGTGLGLSLSYDIVKAHGGEISIDSREMMGSEFTILLPLV